MTLIAAEWYESGSFYTFVVGSLLTVAVGVLAAWAALRAANPRCRLFYAMTTDQRLLNDAEAVRNRLVVSYEGEDLHDPHLVQLQLVSDGSRDILDQQFADAEPFVLDVSATVVAVLDVESRPAALRRPRLDVDGTTLRMRPGHLSRKQEISVSLLVNGEPKLEVEHSLVNVDVRQGTPRGTGVRSGLAEVAWCVGAVVAFVGFLILLRGAGIVLDKLFTWLGFL
ncbi:hypothetical protein [Streptomyces sp. NPDC046261]|uniref:hypothetical protein n=1 Tax=Streptomyces sp. NPDC046261 TaxID=3157200 RepID=UPI003403886D